MIKNLKIRIFLIIMVSLSTIILGTVILFAFLNYRNTLNTATSIIEKTIDSRFKLNTRLDNEEQNKNFNIDGLYYFIIDNDKTDSNYIINSEIEKYAMKAKNKKSKNGIIGKYVYDKSNIERKDITIVVLMESEDIISSLKRIWLISISTLGISICAIYIISRRIADMIVKPVEQTIDKQKQFISDASHELKTPLAVIEANVDVLETEIGENKWMNYIQNEIESMNKLINELLMLAKMENMDHIKNLEQVNVSEKVEIVILMFESMAYEQNVKISSSIEKDINMKINEEDIEHIVSILMDNAIKHTKENKKILIKLYREKGGNIILEIQNEGEEIPEKERDKIFERFYRVDKARNRKEKRYGLGLAILKSIVQQYNGQIKVDYQNGFTIFRIIFNENILI